MTKDEQIAALTERADRAEAALAMWEKGMGLDKYNERIDALESALAQARENAEADRKRYALQMAEGYEAKLAEVTRQRDEAQEPMECGHPGASIQYDKGPEDTDEFCGWCEEVRAVGQVAAFEKQQAEAALAQESARHDFSNTKWFRERKEMVDELVKTRAKIATLERNLAKMLDDMTALANMFIECDEDYYRVLGLASQAASKGRAYKLRAEAALAEEIRKKDTWKWLADKNKDQAREAESDVTKARLEREQWKEAALQGYKKVEDIEAKLAEVTRQRDEALFQLRGAQGNHSITAVELATTRAALEAARAVCRLAERAKEVVFDDPGDAVRWTEAIKAAKPPCSNCGGTGFDAYGNGTLRSTSPCSLGCPAPASTKPEAKPVPMVLYCPAGHQHIDDGEWATRPHKTHQCQFVTDPPSEEHGGYPLICGLEWRPADFPTVGVKALEPSSGKEAA